MKKQTIILVIISIIIILLVKNKEENLKIPVDSIRIRIIANSNDSIDIKEKMLIKRNIEKELYYLLKNVNNIEKAREIINDNLDRLNIVIEDVNVKDYSISFGNNYFPKKIYKGVVYDEGVYESLVITLGNGEGDNWWCVLFPPLCLLDENENIDDVEYKFFVKELINKYF